MKDIHLNRLIMSELKFLVMPCYKNIPQINYIKILEDKDGAIEYAENVSDSLITQINHRIESSEDIENDQKAYDFMMVQNNISVFIVGVNEEGKPNKMYNIKHNPRNNKKTLETVSINNETELPQIKTFNYMKRQKNLPFVD